jgi:hypothetical protein
MHLDRGVLTNSQGYPGTLLELCNVTQQIYLGLDPWSKDWDAKFERRRMGQKTIDGSEVEAQV